MKNITKLSVALVILLLGIVLWPTAAKAATLDVTDYGAVGDGVADDRAAIQAAIDAAGDGDVVHFPAGTYLVKEILFLRSNITLQLDDDAIIRNGINYSTGPSIIFMTGSFVRGGSKVIWDDTENITIQGGTIDMNGRLNAEGTAPQILPDIGSSGAFALGYCDNVRIEGVTFLDSYKGHAIQICACDGVTIKDCKFLGQSLPSTLTDSQMNNLELIQIEPSTTAGFPYAANATGEPSQNVTIQGCYFGASDTCGEPSVAIGTHNQVINCEKCNQIQILNNTFDNPRYAGVRFCGYEDVTIQGNTFIKKTATQTTNYRSSGCFLINAYCYSNTTDELDLNRRITIDNNLFQIADPVTRAIRVAKDNASYLGTVTDITVTNNIIENTSTGSADVAIQTMRISGNLTVTGNAIHGGYRGIEVQYCTGSITIQNNDIANLDYQQVRFINCGDNQTIYCYTHDSGMLEVSTSDSSYTITAVPNSGASFVAYYKQNALTDVVDTAATLTVPISQSTNLYRHASFSACSHTYSGFVTQPTCTARGYTTYRCSTCGYSYKGTYTAPTGHKYQSVTTSPTCTVSGTTVYTCSACGDSYSETIAATGHSYQAKVTAPTCTAGGYTTHTCSGCGTSYTSDATAALGHSYESVVTAPTCTGAGFTTYTCTSCGDSYANNVTAPRHNYVNGICQNCGDVIVIVPTTSLTAVTLAFEDEILYNIYFTADDLSSVEEMGLITFNEKLTDGTIDNAVDVIPGYELVGSEIRVHTNGIPAKNMGDALYFRVYAKLTDGSYTYGDVAGYHAGLYAKSMLNSTTSSDKQKALCVAMVNYGAEAQLYFNYNTDNLINSFLTDDQKALVNDYDATMVDSVVSASSTKAANFPQSGFSSLGSAVSFEGAFAINYYFTPANTPDGDVVMYWWDAATYNSVSVLTKDNATGSVTMTGTTEFAGSVEGIAAKELDQSIYVAGVYTSGGTEYTTGVLAYSIGHYCKTKAAGTTTMADFAAATAVYGYYAKQYFA